MGTRPIRICTEVLLAIASIGLGVAVPAAAQVLTKLPLLQVYRSDEIWVQWESDSAPPASEHVVEWGLASTAENTTASSETIAVSAGRFLHRAVLTGLAPGASIQYRVRSGADTSATFTTRTAGVAGFRMAWLADNQNQAGTSFQGVLDRVVPYDVDFIGHAGDTVQNGPVVQEWHDDWYTPLTNASSIGQQVPVLVARGNHDGETATAYAYHWLPGNGAYHATTIGPVRLLVLDTNLYGETQLNWLAAELASPASQDADFRVVVFHKPPYTNLWVHANGYNGEGTVRRLWVPLFEQYGVDLVVSGHAHAYERGDQNGVMYTIVGGAGGALDTWTPPTTWDLIDVALSTHHYVIMDVEAGVLQWRAYDLNDVLIDEFMLGGAAVPSGSRSWRLALAGLLFALGLRRLYGTGQSPGLPGRRRY
jgi:predicted phosphodiesterase